jgi:hypothetical protein
VVLARTAKAVSSASARRRYARALTNYATTPIPQFARSGVEDGLATATSDGQVILYLKSTSTCGAFQLNIADETSPGSGVYTLRGIAGALPS